MYMKINVNNCEGISRYFFYFYFFHSFFRPAISANQIDECGIFADAQTDWMVYFDG